MWAADGEPYIMLESMKRLTVSFSAHRSHPEQPGQRTDGCRDGHGRLFANPRWYAISDSR